ncbi:hypothetical protein J6590_042819 [Homalodisca vitripennis]|nr:hypothetical protein J6590_042819 [Homalodisca vitripennis]
MIDSSCLPPERRRQVREVAHAVPNYFLSFRNIQPVFGYCLKECFSFFVHKWCCATEARTDVKGHIHRLSRISDIITLDDLARDLRLRKYRSEVPLAIVRA